MRIGTTPTHSFTLPFSTEAIKAVEILYFQNGQEILKKDINDCTLEGNTISCKLTQADTFLFEGNVLVEIQIRVLDDAGSAFASDIMRVSCQKCLSSEVLK